MLYTHKNASGASVHDIDRDMELRHVQSVDTEAGIVTLIVQPIRIDHARGEVFTHQVRFARIYSIRDRARPVLFHCYGRQA